MTTEEAKEILSNALQLNTKFGDYILEEWDEEAIRTLIQPQWTSATEKLPDVNGEYLVTIQSLIPDHRYIDTCSFALDLNGVDEYDFPADSGYANKTGWYRYSGETGYYECDDILAWMELPEVYRADKGDKE